MKAEELRIGNIVHPHYNEGCSEVSAIEPPFITAGSIRASADIFSPVPITTDWLERMGFTKNNEPQEFSFTDWIFPKTWGCPLYMSVYGDEGYIIDGTENVPVKYVHQLQNLYYALTGQELTIKP